MALLSRLPPSLRAIVEPYASLSAEHAPLIGVALVSLAAIYMGYWYIQCQKEAAVAFNVPVPPEVRKSGTGRKWEEVSGLEKQVLEDQVRGVSVDATSLCSYPEIQLSLTMEWSCRNGTIN